MTRTEILRTCKDWSAEDQRFDRWLSANAVIGSLFAAAILGMALGASKLGPAPAVAQTAPAAAAEAVAAPSVPVEALSPYELTIRIPASTLPVVQVDEPF